MAIHSQEVLLLDVYWEPALQALSVVDTEEVLVDDDPAAPVELV